VVQRDYILRTIEQFGQFWSALIHLKAHQQYQEARALLDQTLQRSLGLNAAALANLPAVELIALIRLGHSQRLGNSMLTDRLTVLALMLREDADLLAAQRDHEASDDRALKALQVSLTVALDDAETSSRVAEMIPALEQQLARYDLPTAVKDQLWQYYEHAGQFAKAEDWLFALLDDEQAPLDTASRGLTFYTQLQAKSDAELAAGNLPREEVAASQAELQALASEH
jgi:hypothetical protein